MLTNLHGDENDVWVNRSTRIKNRANWLCTIATESWYIMHNLINFAASIIVTLKHVSKFSNNDFLVVIWTLGIVT